MKVSFTFTEPARVTTITLDDDDQVFLSAKGGKKTVLTGEMLDAIVAQLKVMRRTLTPVSPPRPATTH